MNARTHDDLIRHLDSLCGYRGISAWARDNGISASYVTEVLSGKKAPGRMLLKAMGYERVIMYRPMTTGLKKAS